MWPYIKQSVKMEPCSTYKGFSVLRESSTRWETAASGENGCYGEIGQDWQMPVIGVSWWSPGLQRELRMRKISGSQESSRRKVVLIKVDMTMDWLIHRSLYSSCSITLFYSCTKESLKVRGTVPVWWPIVSIMWYFFLCLERYENIVQQRVLSSGMIWSQLGVKHFWTGLNAATWKMGQSGELSSSVIPNSS